MSETSDGLDLSKTLFCMVNISTVSTPPRLLSHLLLVSLLEQLHVAASLTLRSLHSGTAVLGQVRRRRHAATLRVNPGVNMVGDVAPGNSADGANREQELFTALQHLWRRREKITSATFGVLRTVFVIKVMRRRADRNNESVFFIVPSVPSGLLGPGTCLCCGGK